MITAFNTSIYFVQRKLKKKWFYLRKLADVNLEIGVISFRYIRNIPSNLHTRSSFSMVPLIQLDNMLINYFGNLLMLRLYQKNNFHDRKVKKVKNKKI